MTVSFQKPAEPQAQSRIVQLQFIKERDTKNTTRYQEQVTGDDRPVVGTLYVHKDQAKGAERITITITFSS